MKSLRKFHSFPKFSQVQLPLKFAGAFPPPTRDNTHQLFCSPSCCKKPAYVRVLPPPSRLPILALSPPTYPMASSTLFSPTPDTASSQNPKHTHPFEAPSVFSAGSTHSLPRRHLKNVPPLHDVFRSSSLDRIKFFNLFHTRCAFWPFSPFRCAAPIVYSSSFRNFVFFTIVKFALFSSSFPGHVLSRALPGPFNPFNPSDFFPQRRSFSISFTEDPPQVAGDPPSLHLPPFHQRLTYRFFLSLFFRDPLPLDVILY